MRAIGLMSGTSLDGIDAALIETDGEKVFSTGEWLTFEYDNAFRDTLRALLRGQGDTLAIEQELTKRHALAVHGLLQRARLLASDIAVIGFHGQTVQHRPSERLTWQLGNGALLAAETGIDVVCDFRRADMALGGQGAPLVPLFHAALAEALPKPVAILNIGGVANVTYISGHSLLSFDTGPGNALLNDLVHSRTGLDCDRGGQIARAGEPDERLLARLLTDAFFETKPPKSLDRNAFDVTSVYGLPLPDAAATLTEFTAAGVEKALMHLPEPPKAWYVCGGGRHNPALMDALSRRLGNVQSVDALGWAGDALEAQAFAFLAVRTLRGLPLTLPSTTGVKILATGGAVYRKLS